MLQSREGIDSLCVKGDGHMDISLSRVSAVVSSLTGERVTIGALVAAFAEDGGRDTKIACAVAINNVTASTVLFAPIPQGMELLCYASNSGYPPFAIRVKSGKMTSPTSSDI